MCFLMLKIEFFLKFNLVNLRVLLEQNILKENSRNQVMFSVKAAPI